VAFYRNGHACVVLVCISCLAFSLRFLFSLVLLRFIGNLSGLTVPVSFFPSSQASGRLLLMAKDRCVVGLIDGPTD